FETAAALDPIPNFPRAIRAKHTPIATGPPLDRNEDANRLLASCDGILAAAPVSFPRPTPLSFPSQKADGLGPAHFSTPILPTKTGSNSRSISPTAARPEFPGLFIRTIFSSIGPKAMPGTGYAENI